MGCDVFTPEHAGQAHRQHRKDIIYFQYVGGHNACQPERAATTISLRWIDNEDDTACRVV